MKGGQAVEYLWWVLGLSILTVVRAAADIAREGAQRRTKISLLQRTGRGNCTIDQRGQNVFIAESMPVGDIAGYCPPEMGGD